ncbi:prefoldin subunit 2-like [Schistocerca gregaria]|uniref:prefoldin subunit 2-like n=1 Tax=Schistocerca gregaria TaxID=7010 RepID=UPI00211E942E|nr:prefoldin subunit 2-like [Schistocerca gregaria]
MSYELTQKVPAQVHSKFNQMRENYKKLVNELYKIESQSSEYNIALGAIEKLPPERRCFRLVGQTLVEHSVKEVIPVIKERRKELLEMQKQLQDEADKLEAQTNSYALEHGLIK